jgi:hypothetical protein
MPRRFPTPWREEKFSGGYVVRDATGLALAYLYARATESEAIEANFRRSSADRGQHCKVARAFERVTVDRWR